MRVLVLNAGSSSLKSSLVEEPGDRTLARHELQRPADTGWTDAIAAALADAGRVDAVGHRVVHGGVKHVTPMLISDAVLRALDELRDLAPLHNGPALEVITSARQALPEVAHVACFDTAFHAGLPPAAHVYPLPYEWYAEWGVRRFGFHGLSVAWSVERAAALLGRAPQELRLVVAHLGSGCSVTAVDGGRSVDTSMGFTPLEGLMMGTRAGSIDPGILLELLDAGRLDLDELRETLNHRAGLLGVSGVGLDLRQVQAAAGEGHPRAALALELFVRRAAAAIGAAATTLPTLDAVVFTGGIGEHAAEVRVEICRRLTGIGVPSVLNTAGDAADMELSLPGSRVRVLRVTAREDLVIARAVAHLLG
ncbi:MAG TPA: acetate/propionate family kinase [candidate division Zixibacteria bacterium]|nr:acetate/propionate family kinase [candidate division Zixibacteria bacterium]